MATRVQSNAVDLQKLLTTAGMLEVKAVNAGIEYWQLWMNQAAKLSTIASDTLTAIQNDKGSLTETADRLNKFGKHNAAAFTDLLGQFSQNYFDELGRLTKSLTEQSRPIRRKAPSTKPSARKRSAA